MAKRASNAHILPKSIFKSVLGDINNHLYLCLKCHNEYDSSWQNAMEMDVWALAKKRFFKFEKKITEESKILNYFK